MGNSGASGAIRFYNGIAKEQKQVLKAAGMAAAHSDRGPAVPVHHLRLPAREIRRKKPRICRGLRRSKDSAKRPGLPFDTPEPPPYIPAPQPLAGLRPCGRLCFSGIIK